MEIMKQKIKNAVLVGRDSELFKIQEIIEKFGTKKEGGTLIFQGEPGMGKTMCLSYAGST
jgi:hypothetical protein